MNALFKSFLALASLALTAQATAQVTFYEHEGFSGRSFTTEQQVVNFNQYGFNDRASSVVVDREQWEVCEDTSFSGRCVVLRPGQYPSLAAMGLNDRVSSVRAISRNGRNREPAQVTFYENEGFSGRSFTTEEAVVNFQRFGFNDRASSVVVAGNQWEVCEHASFSGKCVVLRPGRYTSLAEMGLDDRVSSVREVSRNDRIEESQAALEPAQIEFYERENFHGRTFTTEKQVNNFKRYGFNDRASSAVVLGERWEVCEKDRFRGRCVVLRPGRYPSLAAMGLNDRVSSVRAVERDARINDNRYAPAPAPVYDSRRRQHERLHEANVTSVHAVLGTPEQRCWVESEQVPQARAGANIPGAVVGAILGGILGHQVGGGTGKDIATVGGAVAGGAIGANVGRGGQQTRTQDVQRCENVPSQARPDYWDVTYNFRGQEHRVQMVAPPGPTITVNEQGEPRQ